MNKAKYQSEALGVIYEDALFDFNHGFITEERMREYAEGCLVPSQTRANSLAPAREQQRSKIALDTKVETPYSIESGPLAQLDRAAAS